MLYRKLKGREYVQSSANATLKLHLCLIFNACELVGSRPYRKKPGRKRVKGKFRETEVCGGFDLSIL